MNAATFASMRDLVARRGSRSNWGGLAACLIALAAAILVGRYLRLSLEWGLAGAIGIGFAVWIVIFLIAGILLIRLPNEWAVKRFAANSGLPTSAAKRVYDALQKESMALVSIQRCTKQINAQALPTDGFKHELAQRFLEIANGQLQRFVQPRDARANLVEFSRIEKLCKPGAERLGSEWFGMVARDLLKSYRKLVEARASISTLVGSETMAAAELHRPSPATGHGQEGAGATCDSCGKKVLGLGISGGPWTGTVAELASLRPQPDNALLCEGCGARICMVCAGRKGSESGVREFICTKCGHHPMRSFFR